MSEKEEGDASSSPPPAVAMMGKRSFSQAFEDEDEEESIQEPSELRKAMLAAALRHWMPCIPAALLVPGVDELAPEFDASKFLEGVCKGCVHRPRRIQRAWTECDGMGTTVTMVKPMCDKRLPLPPADEAGDAAAMRAALEEMTTLVARHPVTWEECARPLVQSFAFAVDPEAHRSLVEEALCVRAAEACIDKKHKKGMARCIMKLADELACTEKAHMYVCGSEMDGEVRLVEDTHPESLELIASFSALAHSAEHVAIAASEEAIQQVLGASREGVAFNDVCESADGCVPDEWCMGRTCHLGPTWVQSTKPKKTPCPELPPPPTPPPGFFAPPGSIPKEKEDANPAQEQEEEEEERPAEDEWRSVDETEPGEEPLEYTSDWILPVFRLPKRWDAKRCREFGAEVCRRMEELMFSPDSKLRQRDPFSTGMYDAVQQYHRWSQAVVLERIPKKPAPNDEAVTDLWVCMMLASNKEPFGDKDSYE